MTVVMTEGFDMYNGVGANIGLQAKWARVQAGGGSSDGFFTGRFGGQAYGISGDRGSNIRCVLPSSYTSFGMGFAFIERSTLNNRTAMPNLLNASSGVVITLRVDQTVGTVTVSGPGGVIGTATGLAITSFNVWHYFEIYGTVNASTGTCTVYMDGTAIITVTGVNTGSAAVARIQTNTDGNGGNTQALQIDDLFFADATTHLGECKVETLRPASDSSVAWTPSSGANNYSRVNETWLTETPPTSRRRAPGRGTSTPSAGFPRRRSPISHRSMWSASPRRPTPRRGRSTIRSSPEPPSVTARRLPC
jgi:hypothetical protein